MKISTAEFVTGAAQPAQFPRTVLPEVAFAGKSNVGKSSLINALLGRKRLVKTSSTPGKTREVNFFRVNEAFLFVDLPGYGYADTPASVKAGWQHLLETYLIEREALRGVVLIVDARHVPSPLDVQLRAFLDAHDVPILAAANKADKISRGEIAVTMERIGQRLELAEPVVAFSAKSGLGHDALWARLNGWLRGPAPQRARASGTRTLASAMGRS